MKNTTLITLKSTRQELKRKSLQEAIFRKQKRLMALMERYESLKMELEFIRQEYDVRIGRLILKDSQLDFEIIRFRNILSLMDEGRSYEDAVIELEMKIYSEKEDYQFQFEQIDKEEEMVSKRKETSADLAGEIKSLWKKLLVRFHPDLTTDGTEKTEREQIMKRINKAYAEQDFLALKSMDTQGNPTSFTESSIESLEEAIVNIENMIIKVMADYTKLKMSEWYGWRDKFLKAQKKRIDIFKDLERNLLNDIVKKIDLLNMLKQATGSGEFI